MFPVLASMAVLRVVAAADLPTVEATPQMHPGVPRGDTLITNVRRGEGLVLEPSEMETGSRHGKDGRGSKARVGPASPIVGLLNRRETRQPQWRGRRTPATSRDDIPPRHRHRP